MALKGTNALVKVSTDNTTFSTLAQLHQGGLKINGNNIDISKFGDTFMSRSQALKDASISVSGFYDATDTNGQVAVSSALLNDTALYVEFLYNGTNGWKFATKVGSFDVTAPVAGVVDLTIEFQSAGGTVTTV